MQDQLENLEIEDTNGDEQIEIYSLLTENKFIILSIVSFGSYILWWIYKAWKYFQYKEYTSPNPAMRAVFSLFFLIPLFNNILKWALAKGYSGRYNSILLYIGFLGMDLFAYFPFPFACVSAFSFMCVLPPFRAFNAIIEHSEEFIFEYQTSFNGIQKVIISIGSILWFFVIISIFFR